jgi:hypothetical protein
VGSRRILIISLAVILALGVAAYAMKSSSSDNKAGRAADKNTPASQTATTSYTFKEFGVKVNLPSNLKNLTYDPPAPQKDPKVTPPPALRLRLKSFTDLANKCLLYPADSYESFATIVKMPGNYSSNPSPLGEKLVQLDKFYVTNVGSSLPKDFKCKDETTKTELLQLQADLNSSLKTAFSSAQKVQ